MTEAEWIIRALKGHWYGKYGMAYCPAHKNSCTPSLCIGSGENGRLLAYCHAGCTFSSVIAALRALNLVRGHHAPSIFECSHFSEKETARLTANERRRGHALRMWDQAQPISGTIAENYLRGRGITCDLPDTLRFHPAAWHGPTKQRLPALIASVQRDDFAAVHRTFLRNDGKGKAVLEGGNKLMLGSTKGAAVRLSDGREKLVVAEGIETALSLMSGLLVQPKAVWATLSTSGMRSLQLPKKKGQLTIAADGDEPGRAAAHALAERADSLGWSVFMLLAPDNKDWNDLLLEGRE